MALTKLQLEELSRHHWRVFTNDSITKQAITEELARQGNDSGSTTDIFHGGVKVPVYIVDFEKIVLYLYNNKDKVPYSFTAYHRKSREDGWRVWREGKKTPIQKISKEFPLNTGDIKSAALKKKKRDNLLEKSKRKPSRAVSMKKSALMP